MSAQPPEERSSEPDPISLVLTALIAVVLTPEFLLLTGWVPGAMRAVGVTLVAAGAATSVLTGLALLPAWRRS